MKQGDRKHSFGQGWFRYYGTDWVPELVWLFKIKGRGL